ncbi:MAG: methionyl-tRNA formyltransferase [Anaerolineales bacterium]|nr:methionyl-tRNA formyltransferase [Anaerolineales bacterium]
MNIVYFSKGVRGSSCLEQVLEAGYKVSALIAVSQEEALDQLARQYDLSVYYPGKINSEETINQLKSFQADLFILCGYNKILKKPVIELPPLGTINLHGGKLPEYRGAAPINWQIINGETTGGCSIIYLDEGIDTGAIIAQEIYPITPDDTHASVLEKTLDIFPRLLIEVLQQIEQGTVQAEKQDPLAGGYFGRRYPRDSRIDWKKLEDIQVHNLVRGMFGPYPAAFTHLGDKKVEIDQTQLLQETLTGFPGRVLQIRGKDVIVMAKNRALLVKKISVEGEKMDPASYFNAGDELG